MIKVNSDITVRRIAKVVEELKYVSSETFLRGLSLRQKSDKALNYLKEIFPYSYSRNSSNKEFGTGHLRSGFFVNYDASDKKLSFSIGHSLEKNKRAATILNSLDSGSRSFDYIAKNVLHFMGDSQRGNAGKSKGSLVSIFLAKGTEIHQPAREGHHYVDRTVAYIESVIVPELREEFDSKIEARIARFKNGNY